jgi:sugar O-acyltransferase (sialic acid O-acetyltransferase NeuD family)
MAIANRTLVIVSREKEVAVLAEGLGYRVAGVIDRSSDANWNGFAILGSDDDWVRIRQMNPGILAAIALDPPKLKAKLIPSIYGVAELATLISPMATVGPGVVMAQGCLVQQGVLITTDVQLGLACKLNFAASIHHDCRIGDFCTLAPGCRLLGSVTIAEQVFVGAGAIILPHCHVGVGAVIAAGAVVTRDVPPGETVGGVPAQNLKVS